MSIAIRQTRHRIALPYDRLDLFADGVNTTECIICASILEGERTEDLAGEDNPDLEPFTVIARVHYNCHS